MKEGTSREWEGRVRERPTEGMSKWARGGDVITNFAFLRLTQRQHLLNACQEKPYPDDSYVFQKTDCIANANYNHMYYTGSGTLLSVHQTHLQGTPRITSRAAPPDRSEAIHSEGNSTCTELSKN